MAKAGVIFSGLSPDDYLVEITGLKDHPWFVGCQFHPEFTSTPRDGHPLFRGFIEAANAYHEEVERARKVAEVAIADA